MLSYFYIFFVLFVIGLIEWMIYYRTRENEREKRDALSLGIVLLTCFVVLSMFVVSLGVCIVVNEIII